MIRINLFLHRDEGYACKEIVRYFGIIPGKKISPGNVIETRTSIFHNITNTYSKFHKSMIAWKLNY